MAPGREKQRLGGVEGKGRHWCGKNLKKKKTTTKSRLQGGVKIQATARVSEERKREEMTWGPGGGLLMQSCRRPLFYGGGGSNTESLLGGAINYSGTANAVEDRWNKGGGEGDHRGSRCPLSIPVKPDAVRKRA